MPDRTLHLNAAELAMVDGLIAFAKQKNLDDDDDPPSGAAEVHDARNDGIFRLLDDYQRVVNARIRDIAPTLEGRSTLRQLMNLRRQAVSK